MRRAPFTKPCNRAIVRLDIRRDERIPTEENFLPDKYNYQTLEITEENYDKEFNTKIKVDDREFWVNSIDLDFLAPA